MKKYYTFLLFIFLGLTPSQGFLGYLKRKHLEKIEQQEKKRAEEKKRKAEAEKKRAEEKKRKAEEERREQIKRSLPLFVGLPITIILFSLLILYLIKLEEDDLIKAEIKKQEGFLSYSKGDTNYIHDFSFYKDGLYNTPPKETEQYIKDLKERLKESYWQRLTTKPKGFDILTIREY